MIFDSEAEKAGGSSWVKGFAKEGGKLFALSRAPRAAARLQWLQLHTDCSRLHRTAATTDRTTVGLTAASSAGVDTA